MAVRHGYGKIAGTDALVFAYDTGDTRNSYKGRPTTNYGPASFGSWGTENTAERIATGNTYNGQPTYNCRTVVGASWQGIDTTISGLRTAAGSSGTVTMSCMVRNNNSSAYNMYAYIGHDFGSTRTIAANSDWQKVQWTVNQSSMNNDYVEFRPYTNNASVYLEMTMPMVEVNVTYASQFTTGTRSATQGLLDLTGNSTIDISPTSFNSNAEIEYDGSNDYIYVGSKSYSFPNGATVEQIIKPLTLDRQQGFFTLNNEAGSYINFWMPTNNTMRWEVIGTTSSGYSTINCTTVFQTGQYYHVVGTFNGTTTNIYINGVEENGQTMTNQPTSMTAQMDIGRYGGSYPSSAQIPVTKFYNRPLTAAEVANNYRQYKSRFNI